MILVLLLKNLCQNLKGLSDFFLVSFSTSFIDFRLYLFFKGLIN